MILNILLEPAIRIHVLCGVRRKKMTLYRGFHGFGCVVRGGCVEYVLHILAGAVGGLACGIVIQVYLLPNWILGNHSW